MVCDGRTLYAYVSDVPGQVFSRPAPERPTIVNLQPDKVVAIAMHRGIAGGLPQMALLLAPDPLNMLVRNLGEPELADSKPAGGHNCYRVNFKGPDGTTTFWIDQQTYVLRRIVWPTDGMREAMSQDVPISDISLVADFTGRKLTARSSPRRLNSRFPRTQNWSNFSRPPTWANC